MSASEVDQRLGHRAFPRRGILAHRDGDAVEAADRGAAQDVERADAGRRQDQPPAVRLGGGEQVVEQGGVGEGADRRDEKIRAALQHALAVRAHRIVAGAFGHGVEFVGEEARGIVCEFCHVALIRARPLHQYGDELDVLEARALDVPADGAVADETELHDSRPLHPCGYKSGVYNARCRMRGSLSLARPAERGGDL